jgi:LacI family transcriptional regulator
MAGVAAAVGVSIMTVSRALRGHPSIPAKTQERVRRAAARLGYRPDPAVSQLMTRLRASRVIAPETIAWLVAGTTRSAWKNVPANRAIHRGATLRAARLGYRLEEFWLNEPGMSSARVSDILQSRGIRGVLVAPLPQSDGTLELAWDKFAAATCGYSLRRPNLHRACSHQFHAMQVAWEALRARGYLRIGLALSLQGDARVDGMWRAGFLLPQSQAPVAQRVPILMTAEWTAAAVQAWFTRHEPDAVIASLETLDFLRAIGREAPRDFGFVGFNHEDSGSAASINHHMPELGAAAVDLVVEQLHTHQFGLPAVPKVVMVECEWHDGTTLRTPSAALR